MQIRRERERMKSRFKAVNAAIVRCWRMGSIGANGPRIWEIWMACAGANETFGSLRPWINVGLGDVLGLIGVDYAMFQRKSRSTVYNQSVPVYQTANGFITMNL